MRYVAGWLRRSAHAARFLTGPTPIPFKLLWLKAQGRAMSCGLRGLFTYDPSMRGKLLHKRLWYQGIYDELGWWRDWLASEEGRRWLSVVQHPHCPLQDSAAAALVEELSGPSIRILDVGAGPVTHLGYTHPGKELEITAIDPLADMYQHLLKELRVTCPVEPVTGYGESLLDQFERQSFDLVYASNSLDHSYDPLVIIDNMIELAKRDCFVLLRHYKNEGAMGKYHGLHQWNFDVVDGDLVIWNERVRYNISRRFANKAQVQCHSEGACSHGVFEYSDWVVAIFRRL